MTFHRAGVGREKLQVLGIIGEEGGDLTRTILGHSDMIAGDLLLMKELLELGPFIEFDLLGRLDVPLSLPPNSGEAATPSQGLAFAALVSEGIVNLIEAGYEDRILVSQDVCTKIQLKSYGGTGYSFVVDRFLPHLRSLGVTNGQIDKLMVENPRQALTFVEPK